MFVRGWRGEIWRPGGNRERQPGFHSSHASVIHKRSPPCGLGLSRAPTAALPGPLCVTLNPHRAKRFQTAGFGGETCCRTHFGACGAVAAAPGEPRFGSPVVTPGRHLAVPMPAPCLASVRQLSTAVARRGCARVGPRQPGDSNAAPRGVAGRRAKCESSRQRRIDDGLDWRRCSGSRMACPSRADSVLAAA